MSLLYRVWGHTGKCINKIRQVGSNRGSQKIYQIYVKDLVEGINF